MNDLTAIQANVPVPQQPNTERAGRRMESGIDFSTILGRVADRQSETAFSERSEPVRSRPARTERAERADEDTRPAEELAAYASGTQAHGNTPVVEEDAQEAVVAVDSDSPDVIAPVVIEELIPEVAADTAEEFSDELNKVMDNIKAQAPQIQPETAQAIIQKLAEELNVTQVTPVQQAENVENIPVVAVPVDGDTDGEVKTDGATGPVSDIPADSGEKPVLNGAEFIDKKVSAEIMVNDRSIPVTGVVTNNEEGGFVLLLENGEKIPFEDLMNVSLIEEKDVVDTKTPGNTNNVVSAPPAAAPNLIFTTVTVENTLPLLVPNMQSMFQEIAISASLTNPGTASQLVLQLYPEHLGKLRIELTADALGKISARIESANPHVRALFDAGLSNLIDCLRASGIDLKELEIAPLEMELTASDLGHRDLSKNDKQQQDNQNHRFSGNNRQRTITRLPATSGLNYDAAVINSYVDENMSVEFTA
jgi:hypothetical protein